MITQHTERQGRLHACVRVVDCPWKARGRGQNRGGCRWRQRPPRPGRAGHLRAAARQRRGDGGVHLRTARRRLARRRRPRQRASGRQSRDPAGAGTRRGAGDAAVQSGGHDRGTAGVADRDRAVRRVRASSPDRRAAEPRDRGSGRPRVRGAHEADRPVLLRGGGDRAGQDARVGHHRGRRPGVPSGGRISRCRRDSSRSRRSAACSTPVMSWSPAAVEGSPWVVAGTSGTAWTPSSTRTTPPPSSPTSSRPTALVLITGVDAVQLDFGKETQRRLTWMDSAEAERHLAAGSSRPAAWGPRCSAAVRFVERWQPAASR